MEINPYNVLIDRSGTNAEKYALRTHLFGTDEVRPMWVADMDIATPEYVLEAVKKRLNHPVMGYEIMPDAAYEAQIGWFARHHAFIMKRQWLSYSPSVVASLGCTIRALSEEGDEVIVMDPVYPPFYATVKHNRRTLLVHPLRRDAEGVYRFDLDLLASQVTSRTKLLLLCSPHNPLGRVWSRQELEALGAFCLDRGIRIVSDEIHCDLVYAPNRHLPTASLSDALRENTVMLIGPGKTFNMAGFSISTVCIPSEELRERYDAERKRLHWGEGALLSHVAFEAAYARGDAWHAGLMDHLAGNVETIASWASSQNAIGYRKPEGTYLAWLDCRALGMGDRELRDFFVREARLGLSPGLGFGKEGSGFMRLNFAVPRSVLEEALESMGRAIDGTR